MFSYDDWSITRRNHGRLYEKLKIGRTGDYHGVLLESKQRRKIYTYRSTIVANIIDTRSNVIYIYIHNIVAIKRFSRVSIVFAFDDLLLLNIRDLVTYSDTRRVVIMVVIYDDGARKPR